VLVEKLGAPDRATTARLGDARRSAPEDNATPVCAHYCGRLQQLALLEFDRDRKSMSVLCRQVPATRHSGACVA
jgi:Ca2+-transporting ATPase